MKSTFLSLSWQDFLKGLLIAVISPVFTILINSLQAGTLTFDWKNIGTVALAAAATYLSKNLFTDSNAAAASTLQKVATDTGEPVVITPAAK